MTTLTTSTEVPPPRHAHWRITLRRVFAIIGLALLLAVTSGTVWQHVASARARATLAAPGDMVDVGGRDLHLLVAGDGDGPTIVLEAGLLGSSAQWAWVQQHLADDHTVVAYDRPGQGWSDADPAGVDPHRIAADLHTALEQEGHNGPWILVGHSLGGMLVRTFADRYSEDVAGVVLIDSSHPEQPDSPGPLMGNVMRLLGRSGLLRITGVLDRQADGLPAEVLTHALPRLNETSHVDGTSREMHAFERFGQAAARTDGLGTTPLTVISAGDQPQAWHDLQQELATLSSSSRHVTIEGATHLSLVTDHDHARIVADEISRIVADHRPSTGE